MSGRFQPILISSLLVVALGLVSGCPKTPTKGSPGSKDSAAKTVGDSKSPAVKAPPARAQKPPADGVYRWGNPFPRYIDPNRCNGTPGNYVAQNLFEGLLNPR